MDCVHASDLPAWVDSKDDPKEEVAKQMVHDLRQFARKKAEINGQPYTGTHILDEFDVKVFPITVRYNWAPYLKAEREEWRITCPERKALECTEDEVACTNELALPSGLPAAVTFIVPVTQMK